MYQELPLREAREIQAIRVSECKTALEKTESTVRVMCTCVRMCVHSRVSKRQLWGAAEKASEKVWSLCRPQGKCRAALLSSAGRRCSRSSSAKALRRVWLPPQSSQGLASWGISNLHHIDSVTAFMLRGQTLLRGTSRQKLPPKLRRGAYAYLNPSVTCKLLKSL